MKGENKMNKTTKIIIAVVVVVAVIAVVAVVLTMGGKSTNGQTNLPEVNSVEDLTNLVSKVYEGVTVEIYNVETRDIDLTDSTIVKSYTGLENGENLEYAVVSEPMINAQAYSLIMAKVKDGVNANEVAKEMSEKIDTRKWICVTAKQLYATSSGNIVFLVMTDKEKATGVYESFKTLAGTIGEEYERTTEDDELPPDTDTGIAFPVPQ